MINYEIIKKLLSSNNNSDILIGLSLIKKESKNFFDFLSKFENLRGCNKHQRAFVVKSLKTKRGRVYFNSRGLQIDFSSSYYSGYPTYFYEEI